jgi:protein-S-isoprenylcysteine O-methyltransferase Ste14
MKRYYPQMLVFWQFGIIGVMTLLALRSPFFSWSGVILLLTGITIGLWAIRHNRPDNFNIIPELKEGCCLVTSGIYHYIRHPMYTSVMIMMLGVVLLSREPIVSWLLWAALIFVLYLKADREERLWERYDRAYTHYKQHTRYFIPFIL